MADLCPFALKPLASIKREDLAVVYESNPLMSNANVDGAPDAKVTACGHSCSLAPLVSYLHDGGGAKTCPVCQESLASVVCDAESSAFLMQQQKAIDEARIVSFRYGPTTYFLWVSALLPKKIFRQTQQNALDRIAYVLGMDVVKGLKVIHKGKVIYPAAAGSGESSDDVSAQLLNISSGDIIHRRKKPSLVVMGLRQPLGAATGNWQTATGLLFSVAKRLTPRYIMNTVLWVLHLTFRAVNSVVGGVWLFARSLLYPPQPTRPPQH